MFKLAWSIWFALASIVATEIAGEVPRAASPAPVRLAVRIERPALPVPRLARSTFRAAPDWKALAAATRRARSVASALAAELADFDVKVRASASRVVAALGDVKLPRLRFAVVAGVTDKPGFAGVAGAGGTAEAPVGSPAGASLRSSPGHPSEPPAVYDGNPAAELRAAVADLARLPPAVRSGCRYLSLYAVPPEKRSSVFRALSYTLNALSRTRVIAVPVRVGPTLLRISLAAYAPEAQEYAEWQAAWEKLGEAEPYWHLRTEIIDPSASSGQVPSTGSGRKAAKRRIVTVDGGWVDLNAANYLRAMSGSNAALVRADWFIAQATLAENYYAFAGIPAKEEDFLKGLGVDTATIDRLRANSGANLFRSNVTFKPRRVIWSQGPLGGVYETLDQADVTAEKDPIRRAVSVGVFALKYDAGEWFAIGPNGLFRVAVYDSAGKRVDSVLDKIAKDSSDELADGVVQPMISCIRCHTESGLRPFRDDQTRLFASRRIDLKSYDYSVVARAAEFYDEPRLQRQMAFDRETYAAAVKRACGLTPEGLAAALAETVRDFAYRPVTTEQAARELGILPVDFLAKAAASYDPITLNLLERRTVLRGQWESSWPEIAVLVSR